MHELITESSSSEYLLVVVFMSVSERANLVHHYLL